MTLERKLPTEKIEEGFGAHRDQPGSVIAAVGHDPRFLVARRCYRPAIAFGLGAGIGKIQILHPLHLDVQPRKRVADHVGRIRRTAELLPATGIKTMLAQQRGKFALTHLAFAPGVHLATPPWLFLES